MIKIDKKKEALRRSKKIQPEIYAQMQKVKELKRNRAKNSEIIAELKKMQMAFPFDPWAYIEHGFITLKRQVNYAEAAQIAEKGLDNNPNNKNLKKILAEALSHLNGEEKRAEEYFKELIEELGGKERDKITSTYADFLVRKGRFKEAQQIYYEILKESPNDSTALIDLARSYRVNKEHKECLDCLKKCPLPNNPYWLRESGHCLLEKGESKDALKLLTRAKEIANKELYNNQKRGFLRRLIPLEIAAKALEGEWKEAVIWASKQPYNILISTIWYSAKKWLISNNKKEEGINLMTKLLEEDPDSLVIAYQIGRFVDYGDFSSEQRLSIAERLQKIAPKNLYVIGYIARHYQNTDIQIATEYWKKFWEEAHKLTDKAGLGMIISLGAVSNSHLLRKQEKIDEAYYILEQARTYWGVESREIDIERAVCLVRLGSYSEAYEILQELNRRLPDNPVVLDQIGACLLAFGEFEKAHEVYNRKVEIFPEDIFGWQGLGKALFELGRHDDALEAYNKLLAINPQDIDAKWLAASIYQQKGDLEKAQEYIEQIDTLAIIERGWLDKLSVQNKIVELERQRLEQQAELEEARKLSYLGMMATATAHELNQPIGIIRAASDAALRDIEEGYFKQNELQPLLERIFSQTERLAAIIDNFRKFARGDRVHREKVVLNDLVQSTIISFQEQFKHRNIILHSKLWMKRPAPTAWANFFQLEEVLINLLTNARDAVEGKPNARVWIITWRRKGGGCGFSIMDNGPGLPEEYRKNMFVPFFSTKPTEKGTGLGLYISRRIVDGLGGQLRYQDREKGGACFEVNLPPLKG